jgi:CubicO group peptidase (beta-lactamase class C family)
MHPLIPYIESQVPHNLDDIFRIASMIKPITSVVAMMLYDEGKFKLDNPVSKYIPGFKDVKVLESVRRNNCHSDVADVSF